MTTGITRVLAKPVDTGLYLVWTDDGLSHDTIVKDPRGIENWSDDEIKLAIEERLLIDEGTSIEIRR